MLIAFAAVNVMAIGGIVWSVLSMGGGGFGGDAAPAAAATSETEPTEDEATEDEPKAEAADKTPGGVVNLDSFVVNLADLAKPRYLKVDIAIEVANSGKKHIEDGKVRVRDAVLTYLTGLTSEQTMGPLGKSDMRFALKQRINEALPEKSVKNVYFTQFIVH